MRVPLVFLFFLTVVHFVTDSKIPGASIKGRASGISASIQLLNQVHAAIKPRAKLSLLFQENLGKKRSFTLGPWPPRG